MLWRCSWFLTGRIAIQGLASKEQQAVDTLVRLFDPTNNMKSYREALERTRPPTVPLFPILQREILVVLERQSDVVDGLINISKCRQLTNIILKNLRLAGDVRIDRIIA